MCVCVNEFRPISFFPLLTKMLENVGVSWIKPSIRNELNQSSFVTLPFPGPGKRTTSALKLNYEFLDIESGAVRVLILDYLRKCIDRLPDHSENSNQTFAKCCKYYIFLIVRFFTPSCVARSL